MRVLFNGSTVPCYLTNKDASTALCFVVKHAGNKSTKEVSAKTRDARSRVLFPNSRVLSIFTADK